MAYKYITFTVDGNAHRKRFTVEALQTFDGFKQALVTKMNEEIAAEQKDAGDEEIVFVIRDLAYMLDGVEVTINIAADCRHATKGIKTKKKYLINSTSHFLFFHFCKRIGLK
eukprot:986118_1